jgi:hypothetical protein
LVTGDEVNEGETDVGEFGEVGGDEGAGDCASPAAHLVGRV